MICKSKSFKMITHHKNIKASSINILRPGIQRFDSLVGLMGNTSVTILIIIILPIGTIYNRTGEKNEGAANYFSAVWPSNFLKWVICLSKLRSFGRG